MQKIICHFISVHPRYDTRIFLKECPALVEEGYKVYLVVADNKPDEHINGINIISVNPSKTDRFSRIFKTARQVYRKALELNADIYHFHDPELLPFALLLKKKGKNVIYDIHEDVPRDIYSKYWIWKPLRIIISVLMEILENFISRRLTALVTATPFIGERFSKINKETININNYPILKELSSDEPNREKENRICYIGGINVERGIYEVIESLRFTEVTLDLGGEFESELIKQNSVKNEGWSKVDYHGYVSRKKAKEIMSGCKAGIVTFHPHPNHINAQPNKIFEYMSAGLPVIGSDFPLWKTLIEENGCGICVNPLNADEIAKAINYLIANPEIAQKMGEKAKMLIENEFNWDVEKLKLKKLYNKILN